MSYTSASINNPIIKDLIEAEVIPPQCIRFTLSAVAGDAIRINAECFCTEEQLRMIADALISNPEAAKEISRTIIFRSKANSTGEAISVEL